jgi:hypothetical protein
MIENIFVEDSRSYLYIKIIYLSQFEYPFLVIRTKKNSIRYIREEKDWTKGDKIKITKKQIEDKREIERE